MKYTHKLPDASVNAPKKNILFETVKALSILALIAVAFFFALTFSLNAVVDRITPAQEKKLVGLMGFVPEMGKEVKSDYLQALTERLSSCVELPYEIETLMIETKEPNAFALPSGKIYITQGMLQELENENELVYIIGHELGHFKHKHHLTGLGNSLVLAFLSLFLDDNYGDFFEGSLKLSQAKYSQEAEFEADMFGLKVMECGYGNVVSSTTMFQRMNDGKRWSHFLDSHPHFSARIEKMKAEIKEKGYTLNAQVNPLKEKF